MGHFMLLSPNGWFLGFLASVWCFRGWFLSLFLSLIFSCCLCTLRKLYVPFPNNFNIFSLFTSEKGKIFHVSLISHKQKLPYPARKM